MRGIYEEFAAEMAGWRRRYAGRPGREARRLFLLALEREQLVSVAYREALIVRRLATMPISDEFRDLIRHALVWVWKDEEMHAIYVRGVLLRLGPLHLRVLAYLTQAAGGLGGFAASVRQHLRWRDAPLSRALATTLAWAGHLAGKVPWAVRRHLRFSPFRDFCLYNVESERTAALCWARLAELARAGVVDGLVATDDVSRMWEDEERHGRVFAAIAECLDADDRPARGASADALAARLEAVGEPFLPRARRRRSLAGNPLGSGGPVHVVVGARADDPRRLLGPLLDEAGLGEAVRARAAALGKRLDAMHVAIKATFMFGYHRKDRSPITDPALLAELARVVRVEIGCGDVAVVEGRSIYDRFYRNRSVTAVARYLGIESPHFRLVDLSTEQVPHPFARGLGETSVGRTWRDADFRISFGKMRSNPVDLATLTVANLEWLGMAGDEFFFPERRAHRETAIMMVLAEFPPHFALLDAYGPVADGVAGMMGSPDPRAPRRLYAGQDALAVDIVAVRHTGADPCRSGLLRAACHWFGDPSHAIEVRGTDEPIAGWRGPYSGEVRALLSLVAYPVYQYASGRGALFVPEMDEEAFPPIRPEGLGLRLGRQAVRAVLGLRHPR